MPSLRWSPTLSELFEDQVIACGCAPLYEAPDPQHVEPQVLRLVCEPSAAEQELDELDEEAISSFFDGDLA